MKVSYALAGAALAAYAGAICAESLNLPSNAIVVTATRTARTVDESLASVTVITREDIERRQVRSVQDALRGTPGLAITNSGGLGKATSVFLRGTESDHVLVLIDGIKVGSATAGTVAFENLPVEQIERIEIVRGPRSGLYGSEAIGGVIQIFTRKGGGAARPYFSLGGGSFQTYNASAGVSGGGGRGWFNLSASGVDTEGFNACDGPGGCLTVEPDKDGYRNVSGSARAGYHFANGAELDVNWLRARGTSEFDGGFVNESETVQQVVGTRLRFSPHAVWHVLLAAGRSRDESDNFKDGVFMSRFDTERDTISLQNDFSVGAAQLLTAGLDYQDDRIDSTTAFAVTSRDNTGIFVQYQAGFGRQDVQASLRRDDNEQFGEVNTGSAAWGYDLGNSLQLTASYGTAFKAPSFNELFFPDFGNPNLRPEESESIELGLSGTAVGGVWSLNAYQTNVDNLIATVCDASFNCTPENVDRARIRGLEAVIATRLDAWDLRTSLTLLDHENRSPGANLGNVLPRRARQALRVGLDRVIGKYRFGAELFAEGRRFDDVGNTRELPGYATVDLHAEYALAKAWRAQARVENLLDKDYETAAFFNQAERSYYLTLHYQP